LGPIVPGGHQESFRSIGSISVNVKNSGPVAGAEVAQLYIGLPNSAPLTPPKQLRGFQKLPLAPGQHGKATFALTRRDIAYWDVNQKAWVVPRGTFKVYVGSSSRDIREQGSFTV
jgi:beta-glucosidase